ncbi:hypothetical protein [Azospirillum doebereinerae]
MFDRALINITPLAIESATRMETLLPQYPSTIHMHISIKFRQLSVIHDNS